MKSTTWTTWKASFTPSTKWVSRISFRNNCTKARKKKTEGSILFSAIGRQKMRAGLWRGADWNNPLHAHYWLEGKPRSKLELARGIEGIGRTGEWLAAS